MIMCAKEPILCLCFETMVYFYSNIYEFVEKINDYQNFIHIFNIYVPRNVYIISCGKSR